ncbi:MAG TPA: adenosine deaminase, partial [Pedococcus sp.]|nr:adenosine deaminase [Pedococcus sp.]
LIAGAGVALEVCPLSNVALGVYGSPEEVPLRAVVSRGIPVALGADDPLLFGSRLDAQYAAVRDTLGFTDAELADLARSSLRASRAPAEVLKPALADIDAWLGVPAT